MSETTEVTHGLPWMLASDNRNVLKNYSKEHQIILNTEQNIRLHKTPKRKT